MVVSRNDPLESLLSNIQVAFFPIESNFRKVAENLDRCFNGVVKRDRGNSIVTTDDVYVKNVPAHPNAENGSRRVAISADDRKMTKLPIKIFLGVLAERCERENAMKNGFRFELALSFVINGFCQAFLSAFKADKMELQNMNGSFGSLKFARLGGLPSSLLAEDCSGNHVGLPENSFVSNSSESVAVAVPSVEISTDSLLKTALAGGISCSFSTFLMHPIDTVKTQVQASTLSFTEILSKLPQLGLRGLYMGSIPAIAGQFVSHGLRTGICEASKVVLINVAPSLPDLQVQSVASFLGTFIGTAIRIPCEVLKQRLQAGQFNHVGEALIGTWQQDGLGGFFRGTGMTLCRELPFYVAGSSLYAASKKGVQRLLGRELEPWETIAVGAISGGLTAVSTTPFDVIKTRMMTALQGQPTTMSVVALCILREEGPLGLFRGAVPRFFWVAPLGAINFAGYELIRKAMD